MMREKYMIHLDDCAIGVFYHSKEGNVQIGGFLTKRKNIAAIVHEYFGISHDNVSLNISYPQKDRIRFTFKMSAYQFDCGIDKIKEHGFVVENNVRNLSHIMC